MNFLSFLRSVEDLLYELSLWVALVPKTFVKVLFQPAWSVTYVAAESEKEAAERYDGYMPPVIFWVLVSVIPNLLAVSSVVRFKAAKLPSQSPGFLELLVSQSLEARFLAVAAFMLSGPLGFSLATLVARRQVVGRSSLQKGFYTQCYCFGVAYLFLLPAAALLILVPPPGTMAVLSEKSPPFYITYLVSANLFSLWIFYAETNVLRRQMGCGWLKAIGIFVVFLIAAFLLMVVMEFVILIALLGLVAK